MLPPMVVEGQPLCDPEPLPGRDSSPSRLSGVSGLPPQDVDAIEARASRESERDGSRGRKLSAATSRSPLPDDDSRRTADAAAASPAAAVAAQAAALQETLAAMRTQMHVLGERLDALQSAALPVGAERPASASYVELKKRLSIEEIAALKKDTIVAGIRKKMLASVVQDQSYAAESKRQKRASGHAGTRGLRGYRTSGHRRARPSTSKLVVPMAGVQEESKEPTTDPVPARSLDEKTVADLAADAAAAFD